MYFTGSKNTNYNTAWRGSAYIDDKLVLYSTELDGKTDKRQEQDFTAAATFNFLTDGPNSEAGGEHRSVLFDHSALYYFNKTGVFKYNLLDKKTTKITTVTAQEMYIDDTQLVVLDRKGKKYTFTK